MQSIYQIQLILNIFQLEKISENNLALGFIILNESKKLFQKILSENNIKVDLESHSRKDKPIMYKNMADFLAKYEYYLDIKWIYKNKPGPFLSMTGLQALSLGMKVINYEYKIINSLPKFHTPDKVLEKLNNIYDSI